MNVYNNKIKIRIASKKMLADMQTPVGIYLKVRDIFPQSALLEGSDYHSSENGFSFIGIKPIAKFSVECDKIIATFPNKTCKTSSLDENNKYMISDYFKMYLDNYEIDDRSTKLNGLFGYTSFDVVKYFENIKIKNTSNDITDIPEMCYILYKYVIAIDHLKNEMTITENLLENEQENLEEIIDIINNKNYPVYNFYKKGELESPMTDQQYINIVKKGIKHSLRGDVFQVVLSRRYEQTYQGDDFNVYRTLRSINPSPYLFYFDFGSFRVFGSSPETHLKVEGHVATIDPIAGTFFRTGDDSKDRILAEELLKDEKENAEHVMLVDLARNDLNRNATDVKVSKYKEIQYYSHVIHMVSRVTGNITDDTNRLKLFADTFPAGTLSGAPKVKAMQIINKLEPHSRGIYGGCIGYVGFNGNLNQAITIRTFVSKNNKLYMQAGAGIVSKSNPETELSEVKHKLGALKKALDQAEELNQ
ncbi:MAG: anthranilate synthase component I family protein [Bacteroidales bacterium]